MTSNRKCNKWQLKQNKCSSNMKTMKERDTCSYMFLTNGFAPWIGNSSSIEKYMNFVTSITMHESAIYTNLNTTVSDNLSLESGHVSRTYTSVSWSTSTLSKLANCWKPLFHVCNCSKHINAFLSKVVCEKL